MGLFDKINHYWTNMEFYNKKAGMQNTPAFPFSSQTSKLIQETQQQFF